MATFGSPEWYAANPSGIDPAILAAAANQTGSANITDPGIIAAISALPNGGAARTGATENPSQYSSLFASPQDQLSGISRKNVAEGESGVHGTGAKGNAPGTMTFLMPDGSRKQMSVTLDQTLGKASSDLDNVLQAGGRPIGSDGQPMTVTGGVYGGVLLTDSSGKAVPLNVAAGYGWQPGQEDAIAKYEAAGWKPGSPALANPPPLSGPSPTGGPPTGTPPPGTTTPPPTGGPPSPAPGPGPNPRPYVPPPVNATGMPSSTTVTPPTTGGIGNPATATGPNSASLPADANWQDILKYLTNFGLNRSNGSNNLIDLATNQLTNAQNRTNAIDSQQDTVSQFINSMTGQANQASSTRDQLVQGILNNTGLANGVGGAETPTVLQNAARLLNTTSSEQPIFDPNIGGNLAQMHTQLQPFIENADRAATNGPQVNSQVQSLIDQSVRGANQFLGRQNDQPGFTPEGQAALRLNQSELIPGQFNDALSGAYAELQRRGALGGELPGSTEDLARTLAPIYAARATAYSQLNANNILQNEALKQRQLTENRGLASNAIGQLQGSAGQQISANQQAINEWLSTQGLGQNAITTNLGLNQLAETEDQRALQQLLANRGMATSLISTLGGITTGTANLYDPTKSNALAQGGIGDLVSLINAGTGALQTGNNAVNAATGAYEAGNQPYSTATGAGRTLAENTPGSLTQMLLNALLSAGINNAGGIAKAIGGIDWGKIFGGKVTPPGGDTNNNGLPNDFPNTGAGFNATSGPSGTGGPSLGAY